MTKHDSEETCGIVFKITTTISTLHSSNEPDMYLTFQAQLPQHLELIVLQIRSA